ncbi:MAG: cytochrome c, partial [Gammaproteobacteria bacterium]
AHNVEDRATEYRQSLMHVVGWNFSPLSAMVKGKTAFDAAEFSKRADRIAFLSDQLLEGFQKAPPHGVNTDAKAEIWTSFDDFSTKAKDFVAEAKALSDVAKAKDEAKDKAQFKKLAGACKACHDKYKNDD